MMMFVKISNGSIEPTMIKVAIKTPPEELKFSLLLAILKKAA